MTIYKVTDTNTDTSIYCESNNTAVNIAAVIACTKYHSGTLKFLIDIFSKNWEHNGIQIEEIYVI